ncbi:MAG: hypothetical protein CL868_20210 [Cytophagaceae bacterium]|nr:hypothetical protein [Cytophagaceae bacterium]|tara:strand:+ start:1885 stop:3159 length:1275 start_codon:yes stop_codon:yes gene_type:complete
MKPNLSLPIRITRSALLLIIWIASVPGSWAQDAFKEYKGEVKDANTNEELPFANVTLIGTNIAVVTNSEGVFALKVPEEYTNGQLEVSFLGYYKKIIKLSDFEDKTTTIELTPRATQLDEVSVKQFKDAENLVKKVFANRKENYTNDPFYMTAFYRESIKRGNRNVSLAEAVVMIDKGAYDSPTTDKVNLYKARKSTDYKRLDTIALKLQGGPLNALYVDLIKYPEYFMTPETMPYYDFSFGEPTVVNGEVVYVVEFKQKKSVLDPLYFGKLYINSNTLALTNAIYSMNTEDRNLSSKLFVRKKPTNVKVWPDMVNYRVDYREKNGKWYYSYSNVQLEFVVNWRRKLFNSHFTISSEMLVTDWDVNRDQLASNTTNYKRSYILVDEAEGFTDPDFWGTYNVIEPEKSIESAINKIQRQLRRQED